MAKDDYIDHEEVGGTNEENVISHSWLNEVATEVNSLTTYLASKSNVGHTHDARYYTEAESDALLSSKANTGHTHPVGDLAVTGTADETTVLRGDGSWAIPPGDGGGGGTSDHGSLTGLADDDHPQYHTNARGDARYYTKTQVDGSLAAKADTSHSHPVSDISASGTRSSSTYLRGDGTWAVGGVNGADGDSAYDIWLAAGNVGTQQDFLDSLVGPEGPQGPAGEDAQGFVVIDNGGTVPAGTPTGTIVLERQA